MLSAISSCRSMYFSAITLLLDFLSDRRGVWFRRAVHHRESLAGPLEATLEELRLRCVHPLGLDDLSPFSVLLFGVLFDDLDDRASLWHEILISTAVSQPR